MLRAAAQSIALTLALVLAACGGSGSQSAPTARLQSSSAQVYSGQRVTLSWSSDAADTCTASGAWNGAKAVRGSELVRPPLTHSVFGLSCTGSGGTVHTEVSVTVVIPKFSAVNLGMTGADGLNDAGGAAGWTGGLPEPAGAVVAHYAWTTGSAAPVPLPPVLPEPLASCQFGFWDVATCSSWALAINANQQVVVQLNCLTGNPCFPTQFLLFGAASVTPIPDLITATAINNVPQIVGAVPFGVSQHAAIESGGSFVDIGTLGGSESEALGVNDAGAVVGWANLPGDSTAHAFRYANGVMSDLGTLGGARSVANAINTAGTVAGAADVTDGNSHAFVFNGEQLLDLGTLGGAQSQATGINDAGQVVGWSDVADPAVGPHAFLYSDGTMYDLNDYLTQTLGYPLSSGNHRINNAGQILVTACYQGAPHPDCQTFLLTPQVAP